MSDFAAVQSLRPSDSTMASISRMAIRSFSSTAAVAQSAAQQLVRPPVPVFGVDGRYAAALFSAASKQKELDKVERDLKVVGELLEKNKDVAEALKSPILAKQDKRQIIQKLAQQHQLSPLTLNVFNAMIDNNRLSLMPKILKTFATIMSAEHGEVLVTVTTAQPLDSSQEGHLQQVLERFTKKGQKLNITKKVDAALIGGMVVSIGDRYVDMSTASKIKHYSKIIEETVV
ncbi:putative ATP synthase subunit O, mitochondrial [Hypsibius exemplaris]|uniref:Oligomycin sensitivity conferral protein n=1 Tax=Hypsibius exemplaris TaxID=2072580 RepID=A0A1W0X254_HYPEX|nr:putative ATP synthase subunit O, mitochondrial [Hypsibius exemplaris]